MIPRWDHQQMSAELQQICGPYTLSDCIAAFAGHSELHNGTGEMQPDHTRPCSQAQATGF